MWKYVEAGIAVFLLILVILALLGISYLGARLGAL